MATLRSRKFALLAPWDVRCPFNKEQIQMHEITSVMATLICVSCSDAALEVEMLAE